MNCWLQLRSRRAERVENEYQNGFVYHFRRIDNCLQARELARL